jgi:hypothetical protein
MHIIKRPTERAALINTENLKSVHRPTNAKSIDINQWQNPKEDKYFFLFFFLGGGFFIFFVLYVYDLCLKFCTNARQVLVC